MSLTGWALPTLLAVLAGALLVLVVTGRPRARRRQLRVAATALEVIVMNLVTVLFAGVLLNDQYVFYVDWQDLFSNGAPQQIVAHGATGRSAADTKLGGTTIDWAAVPATLPPLPAPGARLQSYVVTGQDSGIRSTVLVYLPAGYDPRRARAYPVIEALHGFPGAPRTWFTINVPGILDAATAARKVGPSILVIPQIDTPPSLDSECVDPSNPSSAYPHVETWLQHDVPTFVATHFHVQHLRSAWATMGYSYGGWCAAMLAMRHPTIFGGAIVLSGYFRPDFSPDYVPLSPAAERAYDLIALERRSPVPVALWVLTSKGDPFSYTTSAAFFKAVRRPTSLTVELLQNGGHRYGVFVPHVPAALAWLGASLRGFSP